MHCTVSEMDEVYACEAVASGAVCPRDAPTEEKSESVITSKQVKVKRFYILQQATGVQRRLRITKRVKRNTNTKSKASKSTIGNSYYCNTVVRLKSTADFRLIG